MEQSTMDKLRSIPVAYEGVLMLGGYQAEPNPCDKRLEYKDLEIEKQNFSKIKEEFQTLYSFDSCKMTGAKVSWGKLRYVKIAGCFAVGSSFSTVDLSFGEGIMDSHMEKCKIKNFRMFNTPVFRSTIKGNKFESNYYSHVSFADCLIENNTAEGLTATALKLTGNNITGFTIKDIPFQIVFFQRNSFRDVTIENGRIKDGKFIGDKLEKVKFTGVKFLKCYFKEIDFSDTEFENCTFSDCLFDDCSYTEQQCNLFGIEQ